MSAQQMVQREHSLPVTRRCELLEVARSNRPSPVSEADLALMRLIDEIISNARSTAVVGCATNWRPAGIGSIASGCSD